MLDLTAQLGWIPDTLSASPLIAWTQAHLKVIILCTERCQLFQANQISSFVYFATQILPRAAEPQPA